MTDDGREHGTYATWNWHLNHGVPVCEPCRAAARAYKTKWRSKNLDGRRRERLSSAANSRALWRLARIYPEEFQLLVDEELAQGGAA
jgi:hypothetical protein